MSLGNGRTGDGNQFLAWERTKRFCQENMRFDSYMQGYLAIIIIQSRWWWFSINEWQHVDLTFFSVTNLLFFQLTVENVDIQVLREMVAWSKIQALDTTSRHKSLTNANRLLFYLDKINELAVKMAHGRVPFPNVVSWLLHISAFDQISIRSKPGLEKKTGIRLICFPLIWRSSSHSEFIRIKEHESFTRSMYIIVIHRKYHPRSLP